MKCFYDYCIYNRAFTCLLREAEINFLGMCANCETVAIHNDDLKILKDSQLKTAINRATPAVNLCQYKFRRAAHHKERKANALPKREYERHQEISFSGDFGGGRHMNDNADFNSEW